MKKIFYTSVFLLAAFVNRAQQLPQYSQYMLNEMAINPAVAGRDEYPEVRSNNRYQWAGITDAPRTYMLTLQGPIQEKHMGLGMNLFTDIVGPTRRTGLSGSYAYHLQLNDKKMFLSMALSAGILQWGIDGNKITLHDDGDQRLLTTYQNITVPDFGAGMYFYQKGKFYVGLSVPQMYQSPLYLYSADNSSKIVRQINLNGAYTFTVNSDVKVEPSFLMKYTKPTPPKIDVGVRGIYQDQVWLGAVYRHKDALSFMVGYLYKNYLMFGYSYDVTTTKLKNYSSGTSEIMLGIRFSRKQSATWETQAKEKHEDIEIEKRSSKSAPVSDTTQTAQPAPEQTEQKTDTLQQVEPNKTDSITAPQQPTEENPILEVDPPVQENTEQAPTPEQQEIKSEDKTESPVAPE